MKGKRGMRQGLKVIRHASRKKLNIPMPQRRGAMVAGAFLTGTAGIRPMLKQLRREYMSGLDEAGHEYALQNEEIDWVGLRAALVKRLRDIPGLLPRELRAFENLVEYQNTLPRKVKFSERATPKLKVDVRVLYKNFLKLYDFTTNNLAMPGKKAADRFYEAAADNLLEYLRSDVEQPVPNDWIASVHTMEVYGEKVVMAMANELADPDEFADSFRKEFGKAFPSRKRGITEKEAESAKYLVMYINKVPLQDIAGQYVEDHGLDVSETRSVANMLGHRFKRTLERWALSAEDEK